MKIYIGVYLTAFLNQHFQLFFCELRMESQQYPPKNPKIMDFLDAFLRQQTGHKSSFLCFPTLLDLSLGQWLLVNLCRSALWTQIHSKASVKQTISQSFHEGREHQRDAHVYYRIILSQKYKLLNISVLIHKSKYQGFGHVKHRFYY